MIEIILAGITIKADEKTREVFSMSDWRACTALEQTGFATVGGGTPANYGHMTVTLTGAAIRHGRPKAPASAMLARCKAQPDLYR